MQATQADFLDEVGYVSDNADKLRSITIWMIILSALFFIAGCIAAIMFNKASKDEKTDDSQVSRAERESNEGLLD